MCFNGILVVVRYAAALARSREQSLRAERAARIAGTRKLASGIIKVNDVFETMLAATDLTGQNCAETEKVLEGVRMTYGLQLKALSAEGITSMESDNLVGTPFDPNEHEAIAVVPSNGEAPPNTIHEVLKTGYYITTGEQVQLLRAASVVVTGEPAGTSN
jgi:molecular chaperone GrpE